MRGALAVLVILSLVLQGCAKPSPHRHGGQIVADYPRHVDPDRRPRPTFGWTRVPAVYVLYAREPRPGGPDGLPAGAKKVGGGWELTAVRLEKGRPLGFKEVDGGVVAVAGADEMRLPPGRYCWHTRPNTEPINWLATAGAVALGAGVAFGIYAIVWAIEFENSWGGWNLSP